MPCRHCSSAQRLVREWKPYLRYFHRRFSASVDLISASVENPIQINGNGSVPSLYIVFAGWCRRSCYSRIIAGDIQTAKGLNRLLYQPLIILRACHISFNEDGVPALLFDGCCTFFSSLLIDVGNDDVCPLFCICEGNGFPDP